MRKLLLWAVVGLFAIFALTLGVSVLQSHAQINKEKTTATTFVQKLLADDTDTTYGMFTTTAQNTQGKEEWRTQVDKLSSFFKNYQPSFKDITKSTAGTSVNFTIRGIDGKYTMTVLLVNSKTSLQVQSFTSLLVLS